MLSIAISMSLGDWFSKETMIFFETPKRRGRQQPQNLFRWVRLASEIARARAHPTSEEQVNSKHKN